MSHDEEVRDWILNGIVVVLFGAVLMWSFDNAARFRNVLLFIAGLGVVGNIAKIGKPRSPVTTGDAAALLAIALLQVYGLMRFLR